jgi:hypothetical protein
MALSPKAAASWGLLAEAGGGSTQVIHEMEIEVAAPEPLGLELEAAAISLELSADQ